MALRIFFCTLFLLIAAMAQGQEGATTTEARPEGGIEELAGIYHRIQFDEFQLQHLRQTNIELLYKVNRQGEAKLYRVTRTAGQALKDSLFTRNDSLPRFKPKMIDGFSQPSFYALGLKYPGGFSRIPESEIHLAAFEVYPTMGDFEFLEAEKPILSSGVAGACANAFLGGLNEFLLPGPGFFLDITIPLKKRDHEWVFAADLFVNGRTAEFPIDSEGEQLNPVVSVVPSIGYSIYSRLNRWTPSFCVMLSNLIHEDEDIKRVQEVRYGPALAYTRFIPIFKERLIVETEPTLQQRYISVSLRTGYYMGGSGIMGNGAMLDLRVGYALGSKTIKNYRFKESFYE